MNPCQSTFARASPLFSDDADWQYWPWPQDFPIGPKANADWMTQNKKADVAAVAKKIWCGISVTLPDTCAADFPASPRPAAIRA